MFEEFVRFVQDLYGTRSFIPLHAPKFGNNERKYLLEALDSTFVSSAGTFVNKFEDSVSESTGANYAIATVNGTAALHVSLKLSGVDYDTEVITQSLTFVATLNAIRYCGATPVLVDVDRDTLGLSPVSLKNFIEEFCELRDDGFCWNKLSSRKVVACLPVHIFGFPAKLDEINEICNNYNIVLIEDAAESLGSLYKGRHTGTIGKISAISFNGNKIITTGGGGMIITNDKSLADRAKHITTTSKVKNNWKFLHDEVGFNYRMPNLNAALGLAQIKKLDKYVKSKRILAEKYYNWGKENGIEFVIESCNTQSNYWLNTLILDNKKHRDEFLKETNYNNVMTRPAWVPMHKLEINKDCQVNEMKNTNFLYDRLVNVPSGPV